MSISPLPAAASAAGIPSALRGGSEMERALLTAATHARQLEVDASAFAAETITAAGEDLGLSSDGDGGDRSTWSALGRHGDVPREPRSENPQQQAEDPAIGQSLDVTA